MVVVFVFFQAEDGIRVFHVTGFRRVLFRSAETGTVFVNGTGVAHRALGYVPTGSDTITLRAGDADSRVILLGGVPFDEQKIGRASCRESGEKRIAAGAWAEHRKHTT